MSSNGIDGLTSLSNNIDLDNKKIVNNNYDDNFKKELIKVLEKGFNQISGSLYSIEFTIKNKNDLKK